MIHKKLNFEKNSYLKTLVRVVKQKNIFKSAL